MLKRTVKVKMKRKIWDIGWGITFTRHKSLVSHSLFLLFIVLLIPELTLGAKKEKACVKYAFSEPFNQFHRLFDKMEQHQVYLLRMPKSIKEAMTIVKIYSDDYQEVLEILCKGNETHRGIEIFGVDNDTKSPPTLPITEDKGSNGKKENESDLFHTRMAESPQEGLDHRVELLVLGTYSMVIFISIFLILIEGRKIESMISEKFLHNDKKEDLRPLNNIQATVQTEYRDEGELVSSSTRFISSGESPVVHTTDHCSFEIDSSEHFSYKTSYEIPCTDSSYKVYSSSVRPDLPDITDITTSFSYLHFSKFVSIENFTRTDYCKNSTYLKQSSAADETRLESLRYDTDTANDTFFQKYENEKPSDSILCTSSEDSNCTNSITSTSTSYPIQSRSLTDIHTSLHTTSLSSNEPESGQMVEVNSLDAKYGQLLVESQTGTENMFQSEKNQSVQTFNEVSYSNTSLQYPYGDMNPRVITEHERLESKHREPNDGHADFTDFEDSFDNKDDSQSPDQNYKVLSYCKNTEESYSLQSTKDIAEYISGVEKHSIMALEEIVNNHILREESDTETLAENLNLLKEMRKTYQECHPESNYLENMKEYYDSEGMKKDTYSETDIELTDSDKKIVKSQNSHESAKGAEDSASLQDGINASRYESFGENAIPENVEANAGVQNVQEKTNLHNVREGSDLQKVEVDLFSKTVKRNVNLYVKKIADCQLHKENGGYSTNLNQRKGPNNNNAVLMAMEYVLDIDGSKFDTDDVEDHARASCCVVGDLADKKSLCKSIITLVSYEFKRVKETGNKLDGKTEETGLLYDDTEELCTANNADNETLTLSRPTNFTHFQILKQLQTKNSSLVKFCFSFTPGQKIFGKKKMPGINGAIETMTVNDTFNVKIMPFVETTSENICANPPQVKIIIQTDKKTELNSLPRRLACFQIFWCSMCTSKFEIRQDHSINVPWKRRASQSSFVLKDDIAGVKDERTCSCKDGIKIINMVLMLTQPIKEDIIWTDKEYVKEIHQNILLTVLNGCQTVSNRDIHSEWKRFAEKSLKTDSKSYIQEKIQKDVSFIRLNNERTLQGKDSKTIILHRKEEDVKLNENEVFEEIISIVEENKGKNQAFNMDGAGKLSVGSTTSGNEGFSSASLEMESKCYNQENVLDENVSLIKLNKEINNKRNYKQKASFGIEEESLKLDKSSEGILLTATEIIEQDLTSTKEDIKIQKSSSVILHQAEAASISSTVLVDEVLKEKSVEKDDDCFKKAKLKEVSFAKFREEKDTFSQVHSDFGLTKACYSTEHEIETRKEDFNEEQMLESFAAHVNVEDGQPQAQPVKKKIGYTEPTIATERVGYAVVPYACISKQATDTMAYMEPCLSSSFKTDSEEGGHRFRIIGHGLARGPDSQECDLSENGIYMDELPVKQKVDMRKEHHPKPNTTSKLKMKQTSRSCDLDVGSHQSVDRDTYVQKKHTYESGIIRSIDVISYKTKEESIGCLPDAAEQKTKDACKPCIKSYTEIVPCAYKDCRYRIGKSTCLGHQQKNSFRKKWKVSQNFQIYESFFQFKQSPQRNDNLDKDEKVKTAIKKRRRKQSQLIHKEQCLSFNKLSNRDIELQQDLRKPLKLGEKSRRISHGSTKQPNRKRCFTRSKRCRRVSKLEDKIDCSKNLRFESYSNDVLEQNLRPKTKKVVWQTLGESIDSGFGTIESYQSDVTSEMEEMEHAFYDNAIKLSSKKMRKLKGKLQKRERKIEKWLSADYKNAIFDPLYFRPEVSSVVVYIGHQRYFERLQERSLSQEESLSYEWLRLESLRNYDGAGSIIYLARGGFYHDPVDGPMSTRCYACNVLYTNWEYFDNVTEVHRRLSPNCPHFIGNASVSGNVSIDNGPQNRAESSVTGENPEGGANESGSPSVTTIGSITDSSRDIVSQIRDIVSPGCTQQPREDRLNTEYDRSSSSHAGPGPGFSFGIGTRAERNTADQSGNTDVNNTARNVTSVSSAQTSESLEDIVQGLNNLHLCDVGNVSSAQTNESLEDIVRRLNNLHLCDVGNVSTAQTNESLEDIVQGLNNLHLCDAGNVSTAQTNESLEDIVQGLNNLHLCDAGNVSLAQTNESQEDIVQGLDNLHLCDARNVSTAQTNESLEDIVQGLNNLHLCDAGNANANGNQVQDEHRQKVKEKSTGGKANVRKGGATGLQGEAKEEDGIGAATVATHTDTESLKAENEKLKEKTRCKICLANPVNAMFLPCGHLACFECCARRLRKCPFCRRKIDNYIKFLMS